jgi:hypothetical protein
VKPKLRMRISCQKILKMRMEDEDEDYFDVNENSDES